MSSDSDPHQLHVFFLPVMASGHMIPMIDIARQFAKLGVKSTIITTPLNAKPFSKTIERDRENGAPIAISIVKFPSQEAGLPEGCENLSSTTSLQMTLNFVKALDLLQEPVEQLLREGQADCIVAGSFFSWAADTAQELNIPRLTFLGTGFFPLCVYHSLRENKPHEKAGSDSEEFVVPGLPDTVRLSRRQLSDHLKNEDDSPLGDVFKKMLKSEATSYGAIVNSFFELEPAYAKHFREVVGRKAWNIGPVSLFNKRNEDEAVIDHKFLSWLDSKEPNSVVYVCFGSMAIFQTPQLHEIAKSLEASEHNFIWVVRQKAQKQDGSISDWPLEEFERRMESEGRGLIIKGLAPQVQILSHGAVGGFVTHCGWNSLLEGVAAGVPMVTWPLSAEQFFNEKLVTEILKTGIPVGAQEWTERTSDRQPIKGENIEEAVVRLMSGEEAERIRNTAQKFGDLAKRAVENGGSSYDDLNMLLEELKALSSLKRRLP